MTNKSNFSEKLDKAGMILSLTCLVHCLILPIILATMPFVAFLSFMKSPLAEALMIVFALANAILAVTLNFKKHKKLIVPSLFLAGSVLLLLNFIAHTLVQSNEYIITIGAALIGVGHLINHKLCDSCPKCHHE
jgi:hypothetical protein